MAISQEQVPIRRRVLGVVRKAEDLEVHTCVARLDGVTVLDIREYVPSLSTYGRGTTLPWNADTLRVLRAALRNANANALLEKVSGDAA